MVERKRLASGKVRVVNVDPAQMDALLAQLNNDPDIEFAEPDFLAQATSVPNDALIASQTAWHISRLQLPQAWDLTGGSVTVAVIDSGVNATHPDLAGRILPGFDFIFNDTDASDDFGHGTAVAGVIVASANNAIGSAGVAPRCAVLPVKVMSSSGLASYSTIVEGIEYAVAQGARVINLSLAGESPSRTLQDAINHAWSNNVVVIAAAGNNANTVPQYPAACEHVIAVSATTFDDQRASFSSYGSHVSIAAPGDGIWTTQRDGSYGAWRGTSFAAPIVAGVAALVASENPSLSATQIADLLNQTADDLGAAGMDNEFGSGRVNAAAAVLAASREPGALAPSPLGQSQSQTNAPTTPPVVDATASDTNAPIASITGGPRNNARLTNSVVALYGRADDDVGIARVELSINGGAYQTVGSGTNWNAELSLIAGRNTVRVRSVDTAGNISRELVRTLTLVVMSPISIQTNGFGSLSPNLDGRLLEIGKTYTVRALPGSNQVFAGWSGQVSDAPVISFVMQSNLTLVANFVPTPFIPVSGNYAGLAADTNGVAPESSGFFNVKMTKMGSYSGNILIAGKRHSFSGRFNLNGDATKMVNRGTNTPIALSFHVDLNSPDDQIAGSISDGNWKSELNGDRNVFDPIARPAQAGVRAFVLTGSNLSTNAAEGLGNISLTGATRVRGKLDDGRVFDRASALAKNGDCPFYLSLSGGAEVIIGWLNFPAETDPTANGTILWVKSGTNGFAATLQAASAPVQ